MPFADSFFRHPPEIPRLARSLRRLAREVDAHWPDRSTYADGWIGDDAHAVRLSDHNPDPRGIVHALDVTIVGGAARSLVRAAIRHPSTEYVINDERIWRRRAEFQPEPYTGPDPHHTHVHVSIRHTLAAERSRALWLT